MVKFPLFASLKRSIKGFFIGANEAYKILEAEPTTAAFYCTAPMGTIGLATVTDARRPSAIQVVPILDESPSRQASGRRDDPIDIEEPKAQETGDRIHPIPVEETADPPIRVSRRGSDSKQPISVEEHDDDVFLQFVIAESLRGEGIIDLDGWEGFVDVDRKGKKPMVLSRRKFKFSEDVIMVEDASREPEGVIMVDEAESSSAAASREPEAYCSICMETKFLHEFFFTKGCIHVYCVSCVAQYVSSKIEDNVTSIGCPDPGCKDGFLDLEICQMILPPDMLDRWGSALCEGMIAGSMKFYCPFKDCSALLIDEGGDDGVAIVDSECPHCCRMFCAQCKVPWHAGFKCEEYRKLGADEREREDLMLMQVAKKCLWQRCPKCKYFVERIDGCMFMKCRCGFTFCYGCATEMTINHYCVKCKR